MKNTVTVLLSLVILVILVLFINYVIFQQTVTRISEGQPITNRDAEKSALLVIDIQEGSTGELTIYDYDERETEEMIKTINQLADSSGKYNIPVIYIKNEITNFLINILNNTYAPGSPGSNLDKRLKVVSEYIINKDKSDAFTNPALDSLLIKNEINKLVFTGLDLSNCVKSTILAAENRNYDICLISNALLAKSDSVKTEELQKFRQAGMDVISSEEYLATISTR